jgi:hypothetical protein
VSSAKDILVRPIKSSAANEIIRRVHYSGKVVNNSTLHLGAFLDGKIEGVMSFGSPLDKRKVLPLVSGTAWTGMLELNRMAFSERLPRNSESRCMAVAFRLIKKHYPHVEWILSFSDGTQCGDGAIYRAAGFVLTQVSRSMNLVRRGDGVVVHKMTLESNPTSPRPELGGRSYYDLTGGKYNLGKYVEAVSGAIIPGHQLRYIYFLNPAARQRLTVPVLPFGKIQEMGAGMYRGEKIMRDKQAMADTLGTAAGQNRPSRSIQ